MDKILKNDNIKYYVADVCKKLRITEGTLRIYEKKGLIKSHKENEDSKKYYTFRDFNTILSIREYRNMNFSLSKSGDLMQQTNLESINNELGMQIININNEINELKNTLTNIEIKKNKLNNPFKYLANYEIKDLHSIYFLSCQNLEKCLESKELKSSTQKWFELHQNSKTCSKIFYDQEKELVLPQLGFYIDAKEFDENTPNFTSLYYYSQQKCLYTLIKITKFDKNIESFFNSLKPLLDYMQANNYILTNDMFAFKLITLNQNGQNDYYEVYAPIA